ncbi:MAG: MFS transporter [Thermoleophilaceae bacterium]
MRKALDLFRHEHDARLFFLAHAQSSLGTGAAYVGLVVLAYDRYRSPWAITAVLLAEFMPGMVLGPLLGAAADRWSRRLCAVVADVVNAAAFVAIATVDDFTLTIAFATAAGAANGLYRPAILAALPGLVQRERADTATAVFGSFTDVGYTVGPALAAAALLVADAELLMFVNGVTFALSALLLSRLTFGAVAAPGGTRPSLFREAAEGLRVAARRRGARTVILASSAIVMFAGLFNVGELLLAEGELGAGGTGYAVLVAVYGAAVAVGSMTGSRGGTIPELARNFSAAILLVGVGMVGAGLAPTFPVALGTFAVAGFGNGLVVVHERLLLQRTVPDALLGRVFGVGETLGSWAFGFAFVAGGAIASLVGTRELLVTAGVGVLVVWAVSAFTASRAFADAPDAGEPISRP